MAEITLTVVVVLLLIACGLLIVGLYKESTARHRQNNEQGQLISHYEDKVRDLTNHVRKARRLLEPILDEYHVATSVKQSINEFLVDTHSYAAPKGLEWWVKYFDSTDEESGS